MTQQNDQSLIDNAKAQRAYYLLRMQHEAMREHLDKYDAPTRLRWQEVGAFLEQHKGF